MKPLEDLKKKPDQKDCYFNKIYIKNLMLNLLKLHSEDKRNTLKTYIFIFPFKFFTYKRATFLKE